MSKPMSPDDELRLREIESQASAVLGAVRTFGPYLAQATPSDWLRQVVANMLVELKSSLPDPDLLRHLEAGGVDLASAKSVTPRLDSYVDVDAMLSLTVAAASFDPGTASRIGFEA